MAPRTGSAPVTSRWRKIFTGKGHTTRVVGSQTRLTATVHLAD